MKTQLKYFVAVLLGAFSATTANAQAFGEGTMVFSVGYGFPNLNKSIFNAYNIEDNFTVKGMGPLHAKFEYGISEKIGIGLSMNHVSASVGFDDFDDIDQKTYNYKLAWNNTKINARLNFHFANTDKLDVYWGFGFGYGFGSYKWTTTDPDFNDNKLEVLIPIGFESTIGARYYVTDNIGIYSEVGFAKSIVQFGLAVRI